MAGQTPQVGQSSIYKIAAPTSASMTKKPVGKLPCDAKDAIASLALCCGRLLRCGLVRVALCGAADTSALQREAPDVAAAPSGAYLVSAATS
eukprot:scaffold127582_cov52-Prasinocladus_malaysianus.AAC.2